MGHDPAAGERLRAFMEPRIGRVQPWAERHGIGRDTIYALWRGREPVPDTINRLASALGVSYRELMDVREGASERPQATETNDGVAAAIDRQTAVLQMILVVMGGPALSDGAKDWVTRELQRAATPSPRPTDDPLPRRGR